MNLRLAHDRGRAISQQRFSVERWQDKTNTQPWCDGVWICLHGEDVSQMGADFKRAIPTQTLKSPSLKANAVRREALAAATFRV